jgi:hypothetical protein
MPCVVKLIFCRGKAIFCQTELKFNNIKLNAESANAKTHFLPVLRQRDESQRAECKHAERHSVTTGLGFRPNQTTYSP